jgi:hypothetical protein
VDAEIGLGEPDELGSAVKSSRGGEFSSVFIPTGDVSAWRGGEPSGEPGEERACERVDVGEVMSSTCSSGTLPATAAAAVLETCQPRRLLVNRDAAYMS